MNIESLLKVSATRRVLIFSPLALVIACSPEDPDVIQISPSPSPEPPIATSTIIPRTRLRRQSQDMETIGTLNEVEKGEIIEVENALIRHTLQFKLDGQVRNISTLNVFVRGGNEVRGILNLADCFFETLRKNAALGEPLFHGVWKTNKKFERIKAEVLVPASLESPFPILNVTELTHEGEKISCEPTVDGEKIAEDLAQISWKGIAYEDGAMTSWYIRELWPAVE